MLTFRFHSTLFTYALAANSMDEAAQVAIINNVFTYSECRLEQWQTPDVWTRRAVDMALAPGIIDTIPRFVVDRKDGLVYLDIDDVPAKLTPDECVKVDDDSVMHCAWVTACQAERERGEVLHAWIAHVVSKQDPKQCALYTRALAGAWGLGPVPEWHAAILPALIALDIETTDCVNAFGDDVFERDIVELCNELKRCYGLREHVPAWCRESLRQTLNVLAGQSSIAEIRATCLNVLKLTNWLP